MSADPLQIVASTADPAFAVDEAGRIVIWNQEAEALLGRSASEVLGSPCHEMLQGRDLFGNRFCGECCPLHQMVRGQEAICSFEVDYRAARGGKLRVGVSIVAVPGPKASQYTLIHLLRPVRAGPAREASEESPRVLPVPTGQSAPVYALTARESEILGVLAKGWSTREIADRLFISVATVRNHVQNILRKLEVHSKVEAVSLALRERLI